MRRLAHLTLAFILAAETLFAQVSVPYGSTGDLFDVAESRYFSAARPGIVAQSTDPTSSTAIRRSISDFSEALRILRERHVSGDRIDYESVTGSLIEGALRTLDPHSNYFNAREYQEFLEEQQSEYSGIGATIETHRYKGNFSSYIMTTLRGSPASQARLSYGDRILMVDGEDVSDRSAEYVSDLVRGRPGTKVRLTVERTSNGRIEKVDIRRRALPQPSIKDSFMLPGGVGYVDMTEGFNYTTSDELSAALKGLRRQAARALIIDLRDNPGGILEQAVRVAEQFLPAGAVIVSQRGRSAIDNRTWRSANRAPETLPVVLLVNENSASAAEIVAGALQDHDRALVVGETTFGKGLVQSLFDAPYGAGLTLTTARYYTPSGRSLQRQYVGKSVYDYYNHRSEIKQESKVAALTSGNRVVFGGDGIEPDTLSPAHKLTAIQSDLSEAIFFYIRDLDLNMASNAPASDVPVVKTTTGFRPIALNDEVIADLSIYLAAQNASVDAGQAIRDELAFVRRQLNHELAMRSAGETAARRFAIENDEPVSVAMAQLPRALELMAAARRPRRSK